MLRFIPTLVFALAAVTPAQAQDTTRLRDGLQVVLDTFRDRYGFPGATAAVALPDGTVIGVATGLADVEAGIAMTSDSRMLAAGIGKTFVAATVLALEGEGCLSRADGLADHLGNRAWLGDLPNARTITIAHLLHHTAGLPDLVQLPAFQSAWVRMATGDAVIAPEDLIGFATGTEPLFEAGTAWAYSDTGYIRLGLVIKDVTGAPSEDAVRVRFLDPLMLTSTIASDRRNLPNLAVGYVAPDNPFGLPERTARPDGQLLWNPAVEWTGGGLASTSHDLALWGHPLFTGAAMEAPYLDRLRDAVPVSGHGGWIPGDDSSLRHYPDHGATVAFQINSDTDFLDDTRDLAPALEAALADLAIKALR